ncbi:MAG: cytidylate kinase family protein, partial [bacterium]
MKNIITISRQFGSGGSIIGQKVAERLGFYYCDKDMIIRTALESGT